MPFLYAFRVPVELRTQKHEKKREQPPHSPSSSSALSEALHEDSELWLMKVGMVMTSDDDEDGINDLFRRLFRLATGLRKFFTVTIDIPTMSFKGGTTPLKSASKHTTGKATMASLGYDSLEEFLSRQRAFGGAWRKANAGFACENGNLAAEVSVPYRGCVDAGLYNDLVLIIPLPSTMSRSEVEGWEGVVRLALGGPVRDMQPLALAVMPAGLPHTEMVVAQRSVACEVRDWFRSGHLDCERFMRLYAGQLACAARGGSTQRVYVQCAPWKSELQAECKSSADEAPAEVSRALCFSADENTANASAAPRAALERNRSATSFWIDVAPFVRRRDEFNM